MHQTQSFLGDSECFLEILISDPQLASENTESQEMLVTCLNHGRTRCLSSIHCAKAHPIPDSVLALHEGQSVTRSQMTRCSSECHCHACSEEDHVYYDGGHPGASGRQWQQACRAERVDNITEWGGGIFRVWENWRKKNVHVCNPPPPSRLGKLKPVCSLSGNP